MSITHKAPRIKTFHGVKPRLPDGFYLTFVRRRARAKLNGHHPKPWTVSRVRSLQYRNSNTSLWARWNLSTECRYAVILSSSKGNKSWLKFLSVQRDRLCRTSMN